MTREELNDILTVSPNSGWTVEDFLYKDDQTHNELTLVVKLRLEKAVDHCDTCLYSPPSSMDGKPCSVCDLSDPLVSCYVPKKQYKEEKKHTNGVWLHKNNGVIWWHECSECGKRLLTSSPTRYCSDCGAFMQQTDEHPEDDEDKEFYD